MLTRWFRSWLRFCSSLVLLAFTQGAQATTILPVFVEPGGGRDVEFHVFGDVGIGYFDVDITRAVFTPTTAEVDGHCTQFVSIHCQFFVGKYSLVLTHTDGTTSDFITVDWGANPILNPDGSFTVDFKLNYYSRPFDDGFDLDLFDDFPVWQSLVRVPENYCERVAGRPDISCTYEQEFFYPFGLSSGFGIVDLAPIPQPATLVLAGTALMGLVWLRRRHGAGGCARQRSPPAGRERQRSRSCRAARRAAGRG